MPSPPGAAAAARGVAAAREGALIGAGVEPAVVVAGGGVEEL